VFVVKTAIEGKHNHVGCAARQPAHRDRRCRCVSHSSPRLKGGRVTSRSGSMRQEIGFKPAARCASRIHPNGVELYCVDDQSGGILPDFEPAPEIKV
jgi:hypothetical protein